MTLGLLVESAWKERRREFVRARTGQDLALIDTILEVSDHFWVSSPDLLDAVVAAGPALARWRDAQPRPATASTDKAEERLNRHVVVRHPGPSDNLALFWPLYADLHWNPEGVFVADVAGELVGGALIWDCGHDVVHLDELTVREGWRKRGVGHAIMYAIRDELVRNGRRLVLGWTREPWFIEQARAMGGQVRDPVNVIAWPLISEEV